VPHKPGVYLHKDRFGTVIYVGKARDLRKRVSQYFPSSRRMGWDLKFNALVEAICDFDVHVVRSEPEALLLESKLIKDFQAALQHQLRDDKRYLMLKVNLNDPIPNFTFHAVEEGRRRALLRAVREFRRRCATPWRWRGSSSTCAAAACSRRARRITSIASTRI
jgi:excinuclease UvrABC nuclease subunit